MLIQPFGVGANIASVHYATEMSTLRIKQLVWHLNLNDQISFSGSLEQISK